MFDLLGNALATILSLFYNVTHSYGMSIILLTCAVRLVLFPLTAKQTKSMQAMSRIQPEMKKLQAEFGDDKVKLNEEMMALYKREGANPASSCLPMFMQIPVFIGLYNTVRGLSNAGRLAGLQIEVPQPKYLSSSTKMYQAIVNSGGQLKSFGIDLAESADSAGSLGRRAPLLFLILLYVVTAFAQQHLATKRNPVAAGGPNAQMQTIMKWFPVAVAIFYYRMPAGLVLYFVASNLWTIAQQEYLARKMPMPKADSAELSHADATSKIMPSDQKSGSKAKSGGEAARSAEGETKSVTGHQGHKGQGSPGNQNGKQTRDKKGVFAPLQRADQSKPRPQSKKPKGR